ncbi:hypothetical protein MesoLj131c_68140 (plasmid) [Mesorhizobium sp. 131-3-5]|nr:hypothetical protein MesoLj131c_68140 [Mesorhizobium sp. 131-3-5]
MLTGSLLLAAAVIRHLPPGAKLGVVVAHEKYVGTDLLGIVQAHEDRARIVVDGISGSMLVTNELKRPTGTWPIPDSDTEHHLTEAVQRLRAAHPGIGALIFECSEHTSRHHQISQEVNTTVTGAIQSTPSIRTQHRGCNILEANQQVSRSASAASRA